MTPDAGADPTGADRDADPVDGDGDADGTTGAEDTGTDADDFRPGAAPTGPAVRRVGDWDGALCRRLAARHGTPLYVIDPARVRANYRRLRGAVADAAPASGVRVQYAAKANSSPAVLRALRRAGAGVEVASPGELAAALAAGFDPASVHYTAVNPPATDLDALVEAWRTWRGRDDGGGRNGDLRSGDDREAADLPPREPFPPDLESVVPAAPGSGPGFVVTAGARDTVDRLADRGYDGRLAVRVRPGVGAGGHEGGVTGADRQFGVPVADAAALARRARNRGVSVVGVHAHVGSGILDDDLGDWRRALERVRPAVAEVAPLDGVAVEFVDAGGGFGVPYREDAAPLSLPRAARTVREALRPGAVDATLVVEPGRYLVADAGVLLAQVTTVAGVDSPLPTVAGADAGLGTLVRPAMFDAHHPVRVVPDGSGGGRRAVGDPGEDGRGDGGRPGEDRPGADGRPDGGAADGPGDGGPGEGRPEADGRPDGGAADGRGDGGPGDGGRPAPEDRPRERVTVGGPACSSADALCVDRRLPRPARGDLLAVGMAGAYGLELASRFHARPLPTEVALNSGGTGRGFDGAGRSRDGTGRGSDGTGPDRDGPVGGSGVDARVVRDPD